jgi:hypothetical protein
MLEACVCGARACLPCLHLSCRSVHEREALCLAMQIGGVAG